MYNHPTPPHTSLHHTHHPTPPHTSSNSTTHLIQLLHTPHPTPPHTSSNPPHTSSNSTIHLTSSLHLLLSVTYNYIFLVYYCGKYCFSCNNKISNIALDSTTAHNKCMYKWILYVHDASSDIQYDKFYNDISLYHLFILLELLRI